MTPLEAFTQLYENLPMQPEYREQAWQTLKAAVLTQQTNNTGSPKLIDAYSELECWAIENHFDNEHCANILAKIEQLRANA